MMKMDMKRKLEKRKLSKHQKEYQVTLEKENKICGPRCVSYKENALARAKSRSNHITGICKKMKELKVATGDEVILTVIKDFGAEKETRRTFASNMKLLQEPTVEVTGCPEPSEEELAISSPGKRRLPKPGHTCIKCGIRYNDRRDLEYESPWIVCDIPGCNVW